MKNLKTKVVMMLLASGFLAPPQLFCQAGPGFDEVYELIRSHLSSVNEEELNRLALEGLIAQLAPRVALVNGDEGAGGQALSRSELYAESFAYLRFSEIQRGAAEQFDAAYGTLSRNTGIRGLVLDLRFAGGDDYAEASAIADRFLSQPRPLLDWETGSATASKKSDAISLPVTVLTNEGTSGAAEALAAVLRDAHVALLIGSATSGQANVYREFPLKSGQTLRVAVGLVRIGSGNPLPADGLQPDIAVRVRPDDEKIYFEDAYAVIQRESDDEVNGLARRRPTEADLVREHRDRLNQGGGGVHPRGEQARLIHDPALARALDVLKGISIVHQKRPR
jgi:hypothetical protein